MNIEEAIERIKELELVYQIQYSILEHDNYIKNKEALELVLNELDKKDKVIDMMAGQIRASDIDEDICKLITEPTECVSRDCKCENCIKEYFYKKAEEN